MSKANRRKTESVLGLAPLEMASPFHTGLVPYAQERTLTREEQRVTNEFDRQKLVIEAQREKTKLGIGAIGEIRDHASMVFQDTGISIFVRQQEVLGSEIESYVTEFNRLNMQGLAHDLLAATNVGSTNIGTVIYKSLDLPPEPPSLWKRLFG